MRWDHYHVFGVPDDRIGQDSHSPRSPNAGITCKFMHLNG